MIQYEGKTLLTTQEACTVLNRSMEALRQMIYRGRFSKQKIGSRIYLDNAEIMTFHSRKAGFPSFEELGDLSQHEKFYTLIEVQSLLNYTPNYLKTLIKSGRLEGYCTADNQILIPKKSLDKFMGVFNEAEDL